MQADPPFSAAERIVHGRFPASDVTFSVVADSMGLETSVGRCRADRAPAFGRTVAFQPVLAFEE